jgi:excisionase family DNA binding protein
MATLANEPRLIPLREAAWQLDVHPETLRRAVAAGRVPAVRFGRRGWIKLRPQIVRMIIDGDLRVE